MHKIWKRLGLLKTFDTLENIWLAVSATQWHSKR